MVYAPRAIVFPFFVIIFLIAAIGLLYLVFLNQPLKVISPTVSFEGEKLLLKMDVNNLSSVMIKEIKVNVRSEQGEQAHYLKGNLSDSFLLPGEGYPFAVEIPLSDALNYYVTVSAPFSRASSLVIPIKPETLSPVEATINGLPQDRVLLQGKRFDYSVTLCNRSDSDLSEIIWVESAAPGAFQAPFFEKSPSGLRSSECKTIYSTLTPISLGKQDVEFHLSVVLGEGRIEKKTSVEFEVISAS